MNCRRQSGNRELDDLCANPVEVGLVYEAW